MTQHTQPVVAAQHHQQQQQHQNTNPQQQQQQQQTTTTPNSNNNNVSNNNNTNTTPTTSNPTTNNNQTQTVAVQQHQNNNNNSYQNATGGGGQIFNPQIPSYVPTHGMPTHHPTHQHHQPGAMYQTMIPAAIPNTVYVNNVTANVNLHGWPHTVPHGAWVHPGGAPQYIHGELPPEQGGPVLQPLPVALPAPNTLGPLMNPNPTALSGGSRGSRRGRGRVGASGSRRGDYNMQRHPPSEGSPAPQQPGQNNQQDMQPQQSGQAADAQQIMTTLQPSYMPHPQYAAHAAQYPYGYPTYFAQQPMIHAGQSAAAQQATGTPLYFSAMPVYNGPPVYNYGYYLPPVINQSEYPYVEEVGVGDERQLAGDGTMMWHQAPMYADEYGMAPADMHAVASDDMNHNASSMGSANETPNLLSPNYPPMYEQMAQQMGVMQIYDDPQMGPMQVMHPQGGVPQMEEELSECGSQPSTTMQMVPQPIQMVPATAPMPLPSTAAANNEQILQQQQQTPHMIPVTTGGAIIPIDNSLTPQTTPQHQVQQQQQQPIVTGDNTNESNIQTTYEYVSQIQPGESVTSLNEEVVQAPADNLAPVINVDYQQQQTAPQQQQVTTQSVLVEAVQIDNYNVQEVTETSQQKTSKTVATVTAISTSTDVAIETVATNVSADRQQQVPVYHQQHQQQQHQQQQHQQTQERPHKQHHQQQYVAKQNVPPPQQQQQQYQHQQLQTQPITAGSSTQQQTTHYQSTNQQQQQQHHHPQQQQQQQHHQSQHQQQHHQPPQHQQQQQSYDNRKSSQMYQQQQHQSRNRKYDYHHNEGGHQQQPQQQTTKSMSWTNSSQHKKSTNTVGVTVTPTSSHSSGGGYNKSSNATNSSTTHTHATRTYTNQHHNYQQQQNYHYQQQQQQHQQPLTRNHAAMKMPSSPIASGPNNPMERKISQSSDAGKQHQQQQQQQSTSTASTTAAPHQFQTPQQQQQSQQTSTSDMVQQQQTPTSTTSAGAGSTVTSAGGSSNSSSSASSAKQQQPTQQSQHYPPGFATKKHSLSNQGHSSSYSASNTATTTATTTPTSAISNNVESTPTTTNTPAINLAPPVSNNTPASTSTTWASLFASSSNTNNSSNTSNIASSSNSSAGSTANTSSSSTTAYSKKPIAKVAPYEGITPVTPPPTVQTPGNLSYSAASAQNLPPPATSSAVAAKKTSTEQQQRNSLANLDEYSLKFAEFLTKYKSDWATISLRPRGLTNRSNYCYINSILQALLGCSPLYNLIRSIPKQAANLCEVKTPTVNAMITFMSNFSNLPSGLRLRNAKVGKGNKDDLGGDLQCDPAFEPTEIYKLWNDSREEHVEGRQEDAEEFLSYILNKLNDEMLEVIKLIAKPNPEQNGQNEPPEEDGDAWQMICNNRNKGSITRQTDFGCTPLSDIFRGELRSRLQREGELSTDVIQPFFTLQLNIEKAASVKEALEILVGRDQLEGVTGSKSKQEVVAWQQMNLEKLPPILILHLKWFDYRSDGCTKILKKVEFPVELKIDTKILASKNYSQKKRAYRLFAVVYHDGKEATKGHYITDVYHTGYGSWLRYDDSSVKPVSENHVLLPRTPRVPYLLCYRRCDTIPQQSNQNNSSSGNNNSSGNTQSSSGK